MDDTPPPLQSSGIRVPREEVPPALHPYVLDVYEETAPALPTGPLRLPVSATTTPTLNVTLTGKAIALIGEGFTIPDVVLGGPQPEAYGIEYHGAVHGFFVLFPTVGPLAVLGVRGYWRGDGTVPRSIAEVVRPDLAARAATYAAAILAAPDFAARAAHTLAFLLDALDTAPPADLADAAFLQAAVDAIERTGGSIRVEALARGLGVSPSTLRRRFGVLGMPVKRFAEVVRFRQAHAYLHTTPGATWADVVHRFGYADQPHLIRDYRRFSGGPPTRWSPDERAIDQRMGIEGLFAPPSDGGG